MSKRCDRMCRFHEQVLLGASLWTICYVKVCVKWGGEGGAFIYICIPVGHWCFRVRPWIYAKSKNQKDPKSQKAKSANYTHE